MAEQQMPPNNNSILQYIIDFFRVVSFRRGLSVFLAGLVGLIVWRTDPMQLLDKYQKNNIEPIVKENALPSNELTFRQPENFYENAAAQETASSVNMENGLVLLLGYKFMPSERMPHEFQGRMLVFAKSAAYIDEAAAVKELGAVWLPIFSGHETVAQILNGKATVSSYVAGKGFVFDGSEVLDNTQSLNSDLLISYGVKHIYRFPIKHSGRVIGYLAAYATQSLDDAGKQQLVTVAGRVGAYL